MPAVRDITEVYMGFFGELKQDLSQVAGEEKKKEEKAAEVDQILSEAEVVGMDEAEKAMDSMSSSSDDDVSALLKDLVSDLGSDVEIPEETASDVSDDLNDILNGLMAEDQSEADASSEGSQQMELSDLLNSVEEAPAADEDALHAEALSSVTEEAAADAGPEYAAEDNEPASEPAVEEPASEPSVGEPEALDVDYSSAVDEVFAKLDEDAETAAKDLSEAEPAVEEPVSDETVYEELKEDLEKNDYKGAEKMEAGSYSDETSVITGGMIVNGDVESEGSLDVVGKVNGDVTIKGKLNVTGHIIGNSEAKEVFAENAKITGNVTSESSVKIGAGTVIVGNISAFSAAIAGAVKGDIDVHGPVILDSTAIVMGNIRSKSVQINNGAALEGVCSQAYAEVSPTAFFDDYKPETKPEKKAAKKKEEA